MKCDLFYSIPELTYEPERLVPPSPWLGHVPFAFWIIANLKPRRVVELGTQSGNSFCAFMQAGHALGSTQNYHAVDHWLGDGQTWEYEAKDYGDSIYRELDQYLTERYNAPGRLIRSSFDDALSQFEDGSIDLLHIDGLHTYEAVKHDFTTWFPKLSSRGVCLFHDTQERENDFGVYKLVNELRDRFAVLDFEHSHGLAVVAVGDEVPDAVVALCNRKRDSLGFDPIDFFAHTGRSVVQSFSLRQFVAIQAQKDALEDRIRQLDAELKAAHSKHDQMGFLSHQFRDEIIAHTRAVRSFAPDLVNARALLNSGFFNPTYYRNASGFVGSDLEAALHYTNTGEKEGHKPSDRFDPTYYLDNNPDVKADGGCALLHFVLNGRAEGRRPSS
ncbi:class I SAM-dependent methyltransferase [Devosia marina]|uniref:class I SAM-dependent methyltransferase n=1 Tax=Devosia marina TaxID=2683198 RepID=UPI0012FBB114|nr:class I SAM-dependent methyltransferase [Devosia marina]